MRNKSSGAGPPSDAVLRLFGIIRRTTQPTFSAVILFAVIKYITIRPYTRVYTKDVKRNGRFYLINKIARWLATDRVRSSKDTPGFRVKARKYQRTNGPRKAPGSFVVF